MTDKFCINCSSKVSNNGDKCLECHSNFNLIFDSGKEYKIGRNLDKGAFSKVYVAKTEGEKDLACKVIFHNPKSDSSTEIEILKMLDHPNVVKMLDMKVHNKNIFILMELGYISLYKQLRIMKTFGENKVKDITLQVCQALSYIHSKDIIHYDITLKNIIVFTNNNITRYKIIDFGLSSFTSENSCKVKGTPNYIAPEVLTHKGGSSKSDIWSLGAVIYTLLIGKPPFETKTKEDTFRRIKDVIYYYPSTVTISDDARNLINNILVKDIVKRYTIEDILNHKWLEDVDHTQLIEQKKFYRNIIDKIYEKLCKLEANYVECDCEKKDIPIFVNNWEDRKEYGLFYSLSNNCVGAYFNDASIVIDNFYKKHKKRKFEAIHDEIDVDITKKQKLIGIFKDKMKKKKISVESRSLTESEDEKSFYVTKWLKTKYAYFFRFNTNTIQVSFNDDTTIIFEKDLVLFFYKDEYVDICNDIINHGNIKLRTRLEYIKDMLKTLLDKRKT